MSKLFSKINVFVIVVFIFGVLLGVSLGISGIGIIIKNLAENKTPTRPPTFASPPPPPLNIPITLLPPPWPPDILFSTSTEIVFWQNLIEDVRTALLDSEFKEALAEQSRPMRIVQAGDITGDEVPEALVYLGSGGAYTDYDILMMIENGKPVVAKLKLPDGKVATRMFLEGASVRNGAAVEMLPEKNAVYSADWSTDYDLKLDGCGVDAYQWNAKTKLFEFNSKLSTEIKTDFCNKLENQLETEN